MTNFKVGDKVRVISGSLYQGREGVVMGFSLPANDRLGFVLQVSFNGNPSVGFCPNELALVPPTPITGRYMIHVEGGGPAKMVHTNYEVAKKEVERLARLEKGKKVYLYMAIECALVEPPAEPPVKWEKVSCAPHV